MEFVFDKIKEEINKVKHGINFTEAQKIWEDDNRIVIPAKVSDEKRFLLIGKIEENIWSAIYTLRNEKIRIISVRRSRDNEKTIYES